MKRSKTLIKDISQLSIIEENEYYGIVGGCNKDAIIWYNIAKNNLNSAKILFDNKQYPHSIFFLQQCVECLIKGIFVECDVVISPHELGHNPEKAFQELYEKMNDETNTENCEFILRKISGNENSFERKLPIISQLVNSATEQYSNNMLISYAKYSYVNTVLFCLAILFKGTEDSSRYPSLGKSPTDLYSTDVIKKYLPSILNFIASIIKILGVSEEES